MRPVDKGKAPDTEWKQYSDAEPYLEERIGAYCSFCELPIIHVPEVEHREAKAEGGEELAWDNLLLSCKYCNTRKGTTVKRGDKEKYLWPDEDDTYHVFTYDTEIPQLNRGYLDGQPQEIQEKASRLFGLVKLDHVPIRPNEKDRRYQERTEARNCALESRSDWEQVKGSANRKAFLHQIGMLAKAVGFFSTWMNVFQGDQEIEELLVSVFKGTRREMILECKNDQRT